jgi:hypothetical protein
MDDKRVDLRQKNVLKNTHTPLFRNIQARDLISAFIETEKQLEPGTTHGVPWGRSSKGGGPTGSVAHQWGQRLRGMLANTVEAFRHA